MVSVQHLLQLVTFIISFELLKLAAIVIGIATLPFRLFRKRSTPQATSFHPKVSIKIHQPADGTPGTSDTIVLIHGYPDSSSMWDSTVPKLTERGYRCVTVDLPGSMGEQIPRFVYPREMVAAIATALEPISDKPFTLVGHDWGSFYGMLLKKAHPNLIHRVVLLDVGTLSLKSDFSWLSLACIFSYQSAFAVMFMVGEPCNRLLQMSIASFRYRARPLEEVTIDMFYHYASVLALLVKMALRLQPKETSTSRSDKRVPPVPMLYIYGAKKPFHFHDSNFLADVRASPCGEVVALPCGHWITVELPNEWTALLTDWLQKSENEISSE